MTTAVGTGQDQQATTTWLQLTAASRLAKVGRTTLHYALTCGELPCATVAGERFILVDDLAAWCEQREQRRTRKLDQTREVAER
jgi:hypothetical protein